ncbi:predicted protein [Sclerotinia sclerotiorum 1980 UF-70]|uniref:Uncharacterized protein n=1 Tax=Sclerotinia sclerotiorum (strain ATCC 18683 / 1980 / Ss-1) TaxID=665079 RepID=A7F5F4_SCLS1|nr:predicted protein [Sclerotinia sclerotiorum 1980 UF-70]EDN97975.1 predicted protein [Sclerotinia sclerotiorum 1980 UF-70]
MPGRYTTLHHVRGPPLPIAICPASFMLNGDGSAALQGFCAAVCELSRPLRAFSAPRSQYEYSMSTGTLIPPYTRHPTNPKVGKIKHVKWFLTALKDNEFTDLPALNT